MTFINEHKIIDEEGDLINHNNPFQVRETETAQLLNSILKEIKIMNLQLSEITGVEISLDDINS